MPSGGFEVGDRVRYEGGDENVRMKTGTVMHCDGYEIAVEFDEDIDGHDCSGYCESDRGWYCHDSELIFIDHVTEPTPTVSWSLDDFLEGVNEEG